ncbi:hypothetical protein [Ectobacillus panaciterrae]|nr:hypothetical protein [Ectobacillus panaciterrae]
MELDIKKSATGSFSSLWKMFFTIKAAFWLYMGKVIFQTGASRWS